MSVQLSDSLVLLRPPRSDDADAMVAAARESAASVGRWLPWCHANYAKHESLAWIDAVRAAWEANEAFSFLIFDRGNGLLQGGCAINEIDRLRLRANLGYWVRSSAQGRGVATAAARLAARFAIEKLAMQRIEIVAAVGNVASQRVAVKLGATYEGRWRNRLRIGETQTDAHGYSIIPSDVRAWTAPGDGESQ
ncbi:MAG TPA: GNAT family protein [Pirellulales bacterium]|nr:GNAT family protein [Pirellulales bacterium]